jgi:hypothetical protein
MGCGPRAASRELAKRPVGAVQGRRVRTARPSRRRAGRGRTRGPRQSLSRSGNAWLDHGRLARPACRFRRHRPPAGLRRSRGRRTGSGEGPSGPRVDLPRARSAHTRRAKTPPGQQLGEHVRLAALRRAPIALPAVARRAVAAVELDPRTRVIGVRAPHPRCAHLRHAPKVPSQPDGLAQREARGGNGLQGPALSRRPGDSVRPRPTPRFGTRPRELGLIRRSVSSGQIT